MPALPNLHVVQWCIRQWTRESVGLFCSLVEYIQKYATEEALRDKDDGESSSSESEMSDLSEDETQDMEI